ncbi:MAG: DNA primase [Lentisphaerota bacterium]
MEQRFIPDEVINEIRARCDIVDVIQGYLPLKRTGNKYKALCPFHTEKTPSFTINQERQMYHCFGCGKGGDVFRFVMEKEGVDFPNAAHILAAKSGVVIPDKPRGAGGGVYDGKISESGRQREKLYKIHEELAVWYSRLLAEKTDTRVAEYVRNRGIPDASLVKFRLGAAPDSWDEALRLLGGKGYTPEDILLAGVVVKNDENGKTYDRFRNRLVFPIWDEQGRVVGFSARTVEKETVGAKYVNSPETPIFKKSRILYALHMAREAIREKQSVILCEGQLDVIAMHSAGFCNTVAPQGTAFTDEQARILRRYTEKVFLCFDSDEAGIKATLRVMDILLPLGVEVRIISFPNGKDPDEFLKTNGPAAISESVENAISFFDYVYARAVKEFDAASPWGKDRIVAEVLSYISKVDSPIVRSSFAAKFAQIMKIPESILYKELNRKKDNQVGYVQPKGDDEVKSEQQNPETVLTRAEETLLELALAHGDVARRLAEVLPNEMISRTPIGHALETVISMTLNGEWENSTKALLDKLCSEPCSSISRLLSQQNEYSGMMEKALNDCIVVIKKHFLENENISLMKDIEACQDENEKNLLRGKYMEKKKMLVALQKSRK